MSRSILSLLANFLNDPGPGLGYTPPFNNSNLISFKVRILENFKSNLFLNYLK